jgi:hypothetical protein
MASRSLLSRIVGGLISAAEPPHKLPLAVAYSVDGDTPEVLAPPERLTATSEAFAENVLGSLLDRFGPGGVAAVGVLAPAAKDGDGLEPCHSDRADGMLVCAAERGVGGAASAGLFRPGGEQRWREAHADAGWICAALRALVNASPLEPGQSGTMPSTSWDETQAVDDDV